MSTPSYISIQGKTQGNVYQEDHEDQILVQEIEHLIAPPARD